MNELENLRPKVREAVEYMDEGCVSRIAAGVWRIIRTELLRLTDECATLKAQSIYPRAQLLGNLADANERAEKAEAELASLKARIAQAPLQVVESLPGAVGPPWPGDHWIEVRMADPCACVGQGLIGKRVRLVVEEPDPTGEHADSMEAWAARKA